MSASSLRYFLLLPLVLAAGCERHQGADEPPKVVVVPDGPVPGPKDLLKSVVRISATQQSWNQAQPWEKLSPGKRRSLGAIVAGNQVLTTAEMAVDATYIELESPDG